ncbi:DUF4328 domain-containing protein [Kitasatospora cineracea]|uniref:DUF4328 domain-containing protein n=1 Tax=Kitasatospora cineracea TaxID=88074 RepID=UPI00342B568E
MSSPASYASPRALATTCSVLLGLSGAVAVWNAVTGLVVDAPSVPYPDTGDLVEMPLSAALDVVFVMWLYRVRVNAEVICPHGRQRGRGWVIGGWFIPFVNFYLPWRITTDIWKASGPTDEHGVPRPASTTLVNAWWSTWVASLVLAPVPVPAARIASESAIAVAAVLAILVVRRLTAMQERHAEAARTAAPAAYRVLAEHT